MRAEVIERAARPGHGEAQALFGAAALGRILGALIKGHGNIRAQRNLHVHGVFGREEVAAAVEMRAEANAFIGDFAQFAEAEKTWKPPESVSMARGQLMKRCNPPRRRMVSCPGRR